MKSYKRIALSLLSVALVLAIGLACVACITGTPVAGMSAYELAVKNGETTLSEEEWLTSLSKGKPGKSAYEIAVDNGFDGDEQKWLASLKGSNGTDGKDAAITISDLFEEYKKAYKEQYGTEYTGTYIEFMQQYFAQTYDSISTQTMVADAIRSCVSVYSVFDVTKSTTDFWGRDTGETTTEKYTTGGAGVIYWMDKKAGDAYIITNYHVVYEKSADNVYSEDIYVLLYGYENVYDQLEDKTYVPKYKIPATYVGGSMKLDVALLYVHDSELLRNSDATVAKIADSNYIAVGEDAVAIGNPKGAGIAVTRGIIAVDSESNTMLAADNKTSVNFRVIRIDTAINAGNSGGGLFNEKGELIGIVHAKNVENDVDNIAYAIPSNIAVYTTKGLIERFEENGRTGSYAATKCLLGVSVTAAASRGYYDADTKRVAIEEDVMIVEEVVSTAAAYGKLQKGDILRKIKIGDIELNVTRTFIVVDAMLLVRVGDDIEITYERDGESATCVITATNTIIIDDIAN